MIRSTTLMVFLLLALSAPAAFGQTIDPVGFCSTATVPTLANAICSTGTGIGGETIGVGTDGFYMFKNGSGGTATNPWWLLVAVPTMTAGSATQPIFSSFDIFTLTVNGVAVFSGFSPSTSGSIYDFVGHGGSASMNAANLFGANEQLAYGGTPSFFDIFVYELSPGIANNTAYLFTLDGSTPLIAGTFLAAADSGAFTTPYTVTGLVGGIPEPTSIALLGTALFFVGRILRKRLAP